MTRNRDVRVKTVSQSSAGNLKKSIPKHTSSLDATDLDCTGQLVHYHITLSSREIQHSGMEEGEREKQREGRIRGEKATDATCQSHRYPDY